MTNEQHMQAVRRWPPGQASLPEIDLGAVAAAIEEAFLDGRRNDARLALKILAVASRRLRNEELEAIAMRGLLLTSGSTLAMLETFFDSLESFRSGNHAYSTSLR